MKFESLSDNELISIYPNWIEEMKRREIIRTNNITGDLGEFIAVDYYNKTVGLPKLKLSMTSSANIDAISNKGERYSIKTIKGQITGTFHSIKDNKVPFEYLIIVKLNSLYELEEMYELTYEQFLEYRHWHNTMNAYNIILNKKIKNNVKKVY